MVKLNKFLAICLISSKTFIFAVLKCNGTLAQLVEQRTENPCVRSSILRGTTISPKNWGFFYTFIKIIIMSKQIQYITSLILIFVLSACTVNTDQNNSMVSFENGDIMTGVTEDPLGTKFSYPTGEAAITSQIKRWEPGFQSPWHYHPYTGVAYVVQG